ncbi:OmpA family protein [bacterium]|nr:OmpA family protein [bacterium]
MKHTFIYTLIFMLLLGSCNTTAQSSMYDSDNKKAVALFKKGYSEYNSSYGDESKLLLAESYLLKALKKDPKFVSAMMLLSEIEVQKGNLEKAIEYKEQGLNINPEYGKNEYFYLSQMQLIAGQYEKCKRNAARFLTYKNTNETFQTKARLYIESCDFATQALKNPVPFNPKNLGSNINTSQPEYFPSLTGDGQNIIFTRVILDKNAQLRGGRQEDFYASSTNDNGDWKPALSLSSTINTFFNEGAPTITADGNFLIFTSCAGVDGYGNDRTGKGSCDLFYARRLGNSWSKPRNLGAPINTINWESQPCFSADGRTLYFIRSVLKQRGRQNPEEQDIYVTHLIDEGYWSTPEKLSNTINTPFREESVFIHPDGQTLYFGSNGHPGIGGMDLFVSRIDENGNWGTPVNLGYPINTSGNENGLVVSSDGELAYFSSDREGGQGGLDIYSFELPPAVKPVYTTYMKGKVFDADSKLPLGSIITIIDLKTKEVLLKSVSDRKSGGFLVNIPTNKELAINVSRDGYFFYSKNFSFNSSKEPILIDIPLEKIKISDKPFVLENIFFDVSKYNLKSESRIELDKLYELMKTNPELKIEVGGHTDSDGDAGKNQVLSEKRAKSVVNYLVMKGIDVSRLKYKGYGQTKPRADNDSKENKALNRRTEVKIIGN